MKFQTLFRYKNRFLSYFSLSNLDTIARAPLAFLNLLFYKSSQAPKDQGDTTMKNEKLITLMHAKGITRAQLSAMSGISATTLNRIINGQVLHVKIPQMQAIAKALNTNISSIFETVPSELPLSLAIRPDEAGNSITKHLTPDESLLLYWYQNALENGRTALLNRARLEFHRAQLEISQRANGMNPSKSEPESYEQFAFDILKKEQAQTIENSNS